MVNDTVAAISGGSAAPGQPMDVLTITLAVLPFIVFLFVLWWGSGKKGRKKMAVEMAYNLIALQLLLFLLLPICEQPFSCGAWALLPIAMFAGLIAFTYRRMVKEAEHTLRVIDAIKQGHIGDSDGALERSDEKPPKTDKKGKKKGSRKKEKKPKGEKKGQSKTPEEKAEHHEHKKIDRLIKDVMKKKGKKPGTVKWKR